MNRPDTSAMGKGLYALRPTGEDRFEFGGAMSFQFIRDRKKKVTGFTAAVERARNIMFNKIP